MAGSMRLSLIINADGTAAIQGLNQVRGSLTEVGQVTSRMEGQLAGVVGQLKSLALTAGAALGVSNLAQSFTAANVAAGTLRAGLETVTGSAQAGAVAWAQLQEFAAQTPFSLQQATEGFIKLKAMGLDPSREALLSYANTASAMGKDLSQMIEAVVDASNSSFERLREFGITASQEGDKVSLTFQGVTTTIGNNAAEIEAYLRRIGEVQFAGAIERQAETLGVALSNVGDAWDQLMVEIGDAGLTAVLVEGLQEITGWISALKGEIADGLGADVSATLTETISLFEGWSATVSGIPPLVRDLGAALAEIPNYNLVIREGTLALEEQGTAWEAVAELASFAGQAFLDLPDNLRAAVFIILGEIDVLKTNFQAGMEQLPLIAAQAWAAIQHAIASAIGAIQLAVAQMVAYVAGQLSSLATDMAGVMAQIPAVLDIGGVAAAAVAGLNDLAASLNSTEASVAALKEEQAALGAQYEQDTQALRGQQAAIVARAETEIAAIRGVIQSGIEEAEAKKIARQAQAELNVEFARAVADQAALEKQSLKTGAAIAGGAKATSGAVKPTKDLASAKGGAAKASKELEAAQRAETQAMAAATRTVEGLVQKYLPVKAAAQDYQESMAALAKASAAAGLSQEELSVITRGLAKDQADAADAARRESDAFYRAWAEAVDSLDDTFQGLWRGLVTGQGDVLGNLKKTVLEWVADLSYQLLLSPLVVPIQTALLGGSGAGVAGTAASLASGASGGGGFGSIFSGIGNWFGGNSLGLGMATGLSSLAGSTVGAMPNWFGTGMAGLASTPNWAFGVGGIGGSLLGNALFGDQGYGGIGSTIGSTIGSAVGGASSAAIAAALGIAIPGVGAIIGGLLGGAGGGFLGSLFGDDSPKYGRLMAATGGRYQELEDWQAGAYAKGAFGLTFGLSDAATKNVDATEYQATFDSMAKLSEAIADFFGPELAGKVQAKLDKWPYIWGDEFANGAAGAIKNIVGTIADVAGSTGDEIGVAFDAMLGTLSGSAEEVTAQIEQAMAATVLAVELSARYEDRLGQMLRLTGNIDQDARRLKSFSDQFGQSGETSGATLARLVAQLGILDAAAQQTGTNLAGMTTTALLTLSDELMDAFGGVEAAAQAQGFYYQEFTSQTEKLVDAIAVAADQLDRAIPGIQDALRGLGDTAGVAQLLDNLPKTRDGFNDLIQSLDLTTAAGRKLYAGLLELAPQFDLLYDGAEAFTDWLLGVNEVEQATRELERVFSDWGLTLPQNRDALRALYESGTLSTEQLAILGAYLRELGLVFAVVGEDAKDLGDALDGVDFSAAKTAFADLERAVSSERDAITEQHRARMAALAAERDAIADRYRASMDALAAERAAVQAEYQDRVKAIRAGQQAVADQYRATLDALNAQRDAINDQYDARQRALAAERDALDAAHEATMDALASQEEAARAAMGAAEAGLRSVQTALDSLRSAVIDNELERQRALAQLQQWAARGALPSDQDALDRAIRGATNLSPANFASQADYQSAQGAAYAALRALEAVGIRQLSDAERQVQAIEAASAAAQTAYDAQLAAIEAQAQINQDWRDAQLDALAAQAEQAAAWRDEQLAILARQTESAETWRDLQLKALDDQAAALDAWRQAGIDALDEQAAAVDAWREANLAALDALLETAQQQLDIALGQAQTNLTLSEALAAFNAALEDLAADAGTRDSLASVILASGAETTTATRDLDATTTQVGADLMTALASQTGQQAMTSERQQAEWSALREELALLRSDLAAANTASVVSIKSLDARLEKWDLDGLPAERDSVATYVVRAA